MKDTVKYATQLLHRVQEQDARAKVRARKARTHRLIVEGGTLEKVMPTVMLMNPEELERFLRDMLCREKPE
ncbi:MAG: DUF3847 domain-containing protein [Clostridia bacterium]|nr:DUF3847 domain-containing protein [Clostridia bacterium]